jgi:chromosome condensin MukBEF ATPase and DNA-binding subunit MukB
MTEGDEATELRRRLKDAQAQIETQRASLVGAEHDLARREQEVIALRDERDLADEHIAECQVALAACGVQSGPGSVVEGIHALRAQRDAFKAEAERLHGSREAVVDTVTQIVNVRGERDRLRELFDEAIGLLASTVSPEFAESASEKVMAPQIAAFLGRVR